MEKLLSKSIKLARKLHRPNEQKFNVYAFMYDGGKLLSIGHNDMINMSGKAHYFAKRYNLKHLESFPYRHAEVDAISRLWGKYHITGKETLVIVRLLRNYELGVAKPCADCQRILSALNLKKVLHT